MVSALGCCRLMLPCNNIHQAVTFIYIHLQSAYSRQPSSDWAQHPYTAVDVDIPGQALFHV